MSDVTYYTQEGLDKLKEELHRLKTTERAAISKAIAEARDKGDLSENAEYDAAKEQQGLHEAKISKMTATLSTARLIDESKLDLSKVLALSIVKIKNIQQTITLILELVKAGRTTKNSGITLVISASYIYNKSCAVFNMLIDESSCFLLIINMVLV